MDNQNYWNGKERRKNNVPLKNLRLLVDRQAEDEGLWFIAETCSENYLQIALRSVHAAVEQATSTVVGVEQNENANTAWPRHSPPKPYTSDEFWALVIAYMFPELLAARQRAAPPESPHPPAGSSPPAEPPTK